MIKCNKCGSTNIKLTRDARGIPSAECVDCNSYIKKMSTGEVIEYYENRLNQVKNQSVDTVDDLIDVNALLDELAELKKEKPICKYCTETYLIGSTTVAVRPRIIDAKYCPMCGRELKATDKDY